MQHKYYLTIILITAIACIAGLLMGFDVGVISGALPYIQQTFNIPQSKVFLSGLIVSAVPIGAFLGATISSPILRNFGRKKSILLLAALFILGAVIVSTAPHVEVVIGGRILIGFSLGLSTMAVPMYLSEISPANLRGTIISAFQLAVTFGLLLAFIINYIFAEHENWRLMVLCGAFLASILGIGMLFMPNSPQWLMQKGREKQAIQTLLKIRAPIYVKSEFKKIKATASKQSQPFLMLFKKPFLSLTIFATGLFMFQQTSGINAIFYYSATIFKSAGFATIQGAILASIIVASINVIATIISLIFIDIVGRRVLFFIGFTGITASLLLLSFFYLNIFDKSHIYIPVFALSSLAFFFSISLGNGPYIMMSEIFPLEIRNEGVIIASMANWGFNIIVSATFLGLLYYLGDGYTFLLYAIITLFGLIYTYFNCPETKGVPLQDIENRLFAGYPLRKLGK